MVFDPDKVANFHRHLDEFSAQSAVLRPGRGKATWRGKLSYDLVCLVHAGRDILGVDLKKKNVLNDILQIIIDRTFYGQWPKATLRRVFFEYRHSPAPAPIAVEPIRLPRAAGQWMVFLQQCSLSE